MLNISKSEGSFLKKLVSAPSPTLLNQTVKHTGGIKGNGGGAGGLAQRELMCLYVGGGGGISSTLTYFVYYKVLRNSILCSP